MTLVWFCLPRGLMKSIFMQDSQSSLVEKGTVVRFVNMDRFVLKKEAVSSQFVLFTLHDEYTFKIQFYIQKALIHHVGHGRGWTTVY